MNTGSLRITYGKELRKYFVSDKEPKYKSTNHERDIETGLDNRGARFSDCETGRFLSVDPWAAKFYSESSYNYLNGNPNNYLDPTGKGPEDFLRMIYCWWLSETSSAPNRVSSIGKTLMDCKPIKPTSRGKDVIQVGVGFKVEKNIKGVNNSIGISASTFLNTKTGLGVQVSTEANAASVVKFNQTLRVTEDPYDKNKVNTEYKSDLSTQANSNCNSNQNCDNDLKLKANIENVGFIEANCTEIKNLFVDCFNQCAEYIRTKKDEIVNPQNHFIPNEAK